MKSYKYTILILIVFLIVPGLIYARQKEGLQKVIKKEFSVTQNAILKISNSFGDVTCTIWEKNEISIEVTISVETTSVSNADKIFSRIDISFRGSDSEVEAATKLAKNFNTKGDFNIDYKVMMPSSVALHLINKFGDVMIKELFAKSEIRVEYGKASLGKLNHGDNLLEVAFGSASIESMKGAVVMIQFSKMRLGYAGSLRLKSKYSDIQAGEVIVLDGTFEGGSIDLDHVSVLIVESKFSSFDIGMVKQKINLKMQFGSFEVKGISPEFKSLVIDNQHGSVKIAMPEDLNYTLDARVQFGSIKFPKSRASFSVMNVSSQEELYQGTVGTNPTATVKIRSEFGSIKL